METEKEWCYNCSVHIMHYDFRRFRTRLRHTWYTLIWAAPSEFVSSSIPSWQTLTAHVQPFRGARDLVFCLKVPLDSLLVWASSEGSDETARMRRLAWTFAARIGDKYQIRLARPICYSICPFNIPHCSDRHWKVIESKIPFLIFLFIYYHYFIFYFIYLFFFFRLLFFFFFFWSGSGSQYFLPNIDHVSLFTMLLP